MAAEERSIDWRQVAVWAVLLIVSVFAHAYVEVLNEARRGVSGIFDRELAIEVSSHIVVAALLPVLYWMHRRWPVGGGPRNIAIHVLGLVPFSLIHTIGMAALRLLWFSGILGEAYSFPITFDRLAYEFVKDIINYGMLSAAVMALRHLFARPLATATQTPAPPSPPQPESPPERFVVRKRGKEIMVEVADIDWIEAAGNYAVLHVGGETLEIRSSLARLEGELDAKRFVRVHKSYVVNVARIAEVTPWISGDWRIRLQDGAEVNLSRRYRQRFEALVPVRS
ncbi:MAG: LytTR family transcriptional regulator [Rhodospirillales bacterium]|nr:LytTR family transcriptional regulator [Rhodospirillales bacterium]